MFLAFPNGLLFQFVTCFVQPPQRRILTRYNPSHHPYVTKASTHGTEDEDKVRVVIVGGGVGGLSIAARIASACPTTCSVKILEKNLEVGGRSGSFNVTIPKLGTFRHERGPSLLLLPHIYKELFIDCSRSNHNNNEDNNLAEKYGLQMKQCIPAYQVVFDDGDRLNVGFRSFEKSSQLAKESQAKMDSYEVNGSTKWKEYMTTMSAYLNCGLPNFIEEKLDLISFPAFVKEALRDYGKVRRKKN